MTIKTQTLLMVTLLLVIAVCRDCGSHGLGFAPGIAR